MINFYDTFAPRERPLNVGSVPPRAASLITQMNRHPRFLSLLGILPNQLRTLLKETGYGNREEALLDLSRTLFFAGFRIWNKRQQLASRFWKDIAPQNREIMDSKGKKRKRRKLDDDNAKSNCKNPFHFLRRYRNLSNRRRTKCPCSNASKESKEIPNQSITTFIHLSVRSIKSPSESKLFQSRADKIRAEHDRGKKRKTVNLPVSKQRKKKNRIT